MIEISQYPYPALRSYANQLSELERKIREFEPAEEAKAFTKPLRALRFGLLATNLPTQSFSQNLQDARAASGPFGRQFPELVRPIQTTLELAKHLTETTNPLKDLVVSQVKINHNDRNALVCCEPRYRSQIESSLAELPGSKVISSNELMGSVCYERIICLGHPRWFPDYVWKYPRATIIRFVFVDWFSIPSFPRSVLPVTSLKQIHRQVEVDPLALEPFAEVKRTSETAISLQSITIEEICDFKPKPALVKPESSTDEALTVRACSFTLYGNYITYLAPGKHFILEFEAKLTATKAELENIHPGMFLVLRVATTDRDYIAAYADLLMGPKSSLHRARVQAWKDQLVKNLRMSSAAKFIKKLPARHTEFCNVNNIRNWAGRGSIGPQRKEDFLAVSTVIGCAEPELVWDSMDKLRNAHRESGREILRSLIKKVSEMPNDENYPGLIELDLGPEGAGKLCGWQIQDIGGFEVVPESYLGSIRQLELI